MYNSPVLISLQVYEYINAVKYHIIIISIYIPYESLNNLLICILSILLN